MRSLVWVVAPSVLLSTLVIPVPSAGQARPDVGTWPASWTPPLPVPVTSELALAAPQERRLPVYDDAGEPIPFSEIEARIDPSGRKGAFWAGLIGVAIGVAIGEAIGSCGEQRGGYQYYCSPREESLRDILPAGLGITLGLAGAWAGWEADLTTWDEALREIRLRRRVGR